MVTYCGLRKLRGYDVLLTLTREYLISSLLLAGPFSTILVVPDQSDRRLTSSGDYDLGVRKRFNRPDGFDSNIGLIL